MAMTREEMQRLASYGRDGDTMLAHINPEEAALLKSRGGSGTINPNTGLPEFKKFYKKITPKAVVQAVQQVAAPIVKPIEKAAGQVTSNLANLPGSVENTVKQVAANPVAQLALAYYMPGISASLAPYMVGVPAAYQTAVATALASTALQVAQGVPFEDALKSATVNAITNTGAPKVADYILPYAGSPQVADALTSIGASAAKTAAMGGSKDDIERNMLAGLTGSALTSSLQGVDVSRDTSRVAGAAAGGAVLGGTTGAIGGAASELGGQASRDAAILEAQKGTKLASADTGTVSDSAPTLSEVTVVGQKQPGITDTSIISPDISGLPKTTPTTAPVTPTPTTVSPDQPILDLIASTPPIAEPVTPTLSPVTVTAPKEPTSIQDTDITLPETVVTGTPESDVSAQKGKAPVDEPVVEKKEKYKPNLFIYGGKSPSASTLGSSLKTQAPFYPLAGTSGGLTSTRGAGELESKETGKPRKNVWNEESLRLKDALGV